MVEALNLTINQEINGLKISAMIFFETKINGHIQRFLSFSCLIRGFSMAIS